MKTNTTKSNISGHQTYALTFDWAQKIARLNSVGIKVPQDDDPFFAEVCNGLVSMIRGCYPGVQIRAVSMRALADEILSRAMAQRALLAKAEIITTCPEISQEGGGHILQVNRLIDSTGEIIGIGPRPGYPSISDQICLLSNIGSDRPLILVEDGTFSGKTIIAVLEMAKHYHVHIAAVVVGFAFPKALARLKQCYNGELIVVEELDNYLDWMPDHDFFPFSPNCGRVIGVRWNGSSLPFYTHNGANYSVPYLQTFCPMHDWTSIPEDRCREFSIYCVEADKELFTRIDALNGRHILISDLVDTRFKISVPIALNQSGLPHLDTGIVEFLNETLMSLS